MANSHGIPSEPILFPGQLAPGVPFVVPGLVSRKIISGNSRALASMTLMDALSLYLESHGRTLKGRTGTNYKQSARMLGRFFGEMLSREVHVGQLDGYQEARLINHEDRWRKPAGPSLINHELSLVQQVLKRANLWDRIAGLYRPLPVMQMRSHKVMTDVEERRLFAVAASNPDWELVYLVATLTANTTSAGCELRNLRLADVILDAEPRIKVDPATAKNVYRGRSIPLNLAAQDAARRCLSRALALGARRSDHYVFPFRVKRGTWDPTRPASASWLKSQWLELREASGLKWLTPHCLRHQAITKLLESGASAETVRQIAGHVSEAMLKVYSHSRFKRQATALACLDTSQYAEEARQPKWKKRRGPEGKICCYCKSLLSPPCPGREHPCEHCMRPGRACIAFTCALRSA